MHKAMEIEIKQTNTSSSVQSKTLSTNRSQQFPNPNLNKIEPNTNMPYSCSFNTQNASFNQGNQASYFPNSNPNLSNFNFLLNQKTEIKKLYEEFYRLKEANEYEYDLLLDNNFVDPSIIYGIYYSSLRLDIAFKNQLQRFVLIGTQEAKVNDFVKCFVKNYDLFFSEEKTELKNIFLVVKFTSENNNFDIDDSKLNECKINKNRENNSNRPNEEQLSVDPLNNNDNRNYKKFKTDKNENFHLIDKTQEENSFEECNENLNDLEMNLKKELLNAEPNLPKLYSCTIEKECGIRFNKKDLLAAGHSDIASTLKHLDDNRCLCETDSKKCAHEKNEILNFIDNDINEKEEAENLNFEVHNFNNNYNNNDAEEDQNYDNYEYFSSKDKIINLENIIYILEVPLEDFNSDLIEKEKILNSEYFIFPVSNIGKSLSKSVSLNYKNNFSKNQKNKNDKKSKIIIKKRIQLNNYKFLKQFLDFESDLIHKYIEDKKLKIKESINKRLVNKQEWHEDPYFRNNLEKKLHKRNILINLFSTKNIFSENLIRIYSDFINGEKIDIQKLIFNYCVLNDIENITSNDIIRLSQSDFFDQTFIEEIELSAENNSFCNNANSICENFEDGVNDSNNNRFCGYNNISNSAIENSLLGATKKILSLENYNSENAFLECKKIAKFLISQKNNIPFKQENIKHELCPNLNKKVNNHNDTIINPSNSNSKIANESNKCQEKASDLNKENENSMNNSNNESNNNTKNNFFKHQNKYSNKIYSQFSCKNISKSNENLESNHYKLNNNVNINNNLNEMNSSKYIELGQKFIGNLFKKFCAKIFSVTDKNHKAFFYSTQYTLINQELKEILKKIENLHLAESMYIQANQEDEEEINNQKIKKSKSVAIADENKSEKYNLLDSKVIEAHSIDNSDNNSILEEDQNLNINKDKEVQEEPNVYVIANSMEANQARSNQIKTKEEEEYNLTNNNTCLVEKNFPELSYSIQVQKEEIFTHELCENKLFQRLYFENAENRIYKSFLDFKKYKLDLILKNANAFQKPVKDLEKSFADTLKSNAQAEILHFHSNYQRYSTIINDLLSIYANVNYSYKISNKREMDQTLHLYSIIIKLKKSEFDWETSGFIESFLEDLDTYYRNETAKIEAYSASIKIFTKSKLNEMEQMFHNTIQELKIKTDNFLNEISERNIVLILNIIEELKQKGYLNDFIANYLMNIQNLINLKNFDFDFYYENIARQLLIRLGFSGGVALASGAIGFGITRVLTVITADAVSGSIAGPVGAVAGTAFGLLTLIGSSIKYFNDNKNEFYKKYQEIKGKTDVFYSLLREKVEEFAERNNEEITDRLKKLVSYIEFTIRKYLQINNVI